MLVGSVTVKVENEDNEDECMPVEKHSQGRELRWWLEATLPVTSSTSEDGEPETEPPVLSPPRFIPVPGSLAGPRRCCPLKGGSLSAVGVAVVCVVNPQSFPCYVPWSLKYYSVRFVSWHRLFKYHLNCYTYINTQSSFLRLLYYLLSWDRHTLSRHY